MTSSLAADHGDGSLTVALERACGVLQFAPAGNNGSVVYGHGGRSLGCTVIDADGRLRWLRLVFASRRGGKLWDGPYSADQALPDTLPRPHLVDSYEWSEGQRWYQATVWTYLAQPVISPSPDLACPVDLDDAWWSQLVDAMTVLAEVEVPRKRLVLTQDYIHRIGAFIPDVVRLGFDTTVRRWCSAHGDLHWANLTRTPLAILDWEGWGLAPAGFDAALLYAYTLAVPETAARVRTAFASVLDTPDGLLAELVAAATIVQAGQRDPVHARLAPLVLDHARVLLRR